MVCSVLASVALASVASAAPPKRAASGPRAWSNPVAFDLAKEAIEAKKSGDARLCVQKDKASLALEEHPYVKLHLSACLGSLARYREALAAARDALAAGLRNEDAELTSAAQTRVNEILPRLPHVRFTLPKNADGIKIVMNGVPVRPEIVKERFSVDPGDYVVEAERRDAQGRWFFREKGTLAEGEDKKIEILLRPDFLAPPVEECLRTAETYEQKLACIEEKSTKPNVRVGIDFSAYTDTTNVHVVTPGINASIVSPTAGWNVGGSYLLDVVTAASPDIVSMASRRFREQRHAGSLNGGGKIGSVGVAGSGNVSREPDYLSTTGGITSNVELWNKQIVPRIGYALTYDRIGIRDTPYAQFERNLTTHEMEAGCTFVLSPTTVLVTGMTAQIERGEQSKLYRFVPLFDPDTAARIPAGATIDLVNGADDNGNPIRLPFRARELLPRSRDRFAVAARLVHRAGNATLRIEERLYADTWDVKATTTDARYLVDLGDRLRVWPHVRLHAQTGASFYQLAYAAGVDIDGRAVSLVKYRTGDRELSPMVTGTIGGGARIALTNDRAEVRYAIVLVGDLMYSRYFQSLFIMSRTAVYGTIGFEVEL
jgi:hypothetical protein